MKNQFVKSLFAALMMTVIIFGGNAVFAVGKNAKTINGAKIKVAAKHPKTVRISVTKDGFSPSEIRVEKGYPLTLIFNRVDNKGCGKEVVFSSLNIRKKLPLKKDVIIIITPDQTGEIAFACGMGMMKGSIVAH